MNNLTARGYVISRLDQDLVDQFHREERRDGYCWTPHRIVKRFNLPEIGEVAESSYRDVETSLWKIYEIARAEFKKNHIGCCFKPYSSKQSMGCPDNPDVFVQHMADMRIIQNKIAFPTGGVGKLRDRFSGNMREEAA